MIHDTRSPYQKAKARERCPTCGHRPEDEMDRLRESEMGGSSYTQRTCERCQGSGFDPGVFGQSACGACDGSGTVVEVKHW